MTLPAPVTRAADAVMTGPMLIEWIASWLLRRGVDAVYAEQLAVVASISTLLLCAWIVNFVTKLCGELSRTARIPGRSWCARQGP